MITAALLLGELVLMLWLVWCLVRKRPPGEPPTLGILSFTEERYDPKTDPALLKKGKNRTPGPGGRPNA
jgi:hypothetical protein